MEKQEFQSPQNPKTQPKDTIISPRFRSVAAMAGWDEDALLSATLIVEDTPEREIGNKKRHRFSLTSSTSSRRKRRSQRNNPAAPPSYPIVILNLDDDDDDDDDAKTVEKAKNDSKKTEKPKLQAMDENPLPVEASAAVSSSSSDKDLPCMEKLREELSCAICLEICFEPSTTPCGHSFCMKCLKSAADKCGKRCPKCRQLVGNGRSCTVNTVLWNTIQLLFPQEVEARKAAGAVNSREAVSRRPGTETHNPRIRSTRSSAVMINGGVREIPPRNPNVANYNGSSRSSRSSAVMINEVSVRSREIPPRNPNVANYNGSTRSSWSSAVMINGVSVREIPPRNPNVANYNGSTRSSRSSIVVTNEVSVRRGRGVSIQAEDAALAFRLQRDEFMEAFRGTDEQSGATSSVSSTRADIRARTLRAISLRSRQPM